MRALVKRAGGSVAGKVKLRHFIICKKRGGGEKMVSCESVCCEFVGERR